MVRKQRKWQLFLKKDGSLDVVTIVLIVTLFVVQLAQWLPFWDMLAGIKSLMLTR